jgi:hypothetical protein
MALGIVSIAATLGLDLRLLRTSGLGFTVLEGIYYVVALAALVIGWYFNFQYIDQYGANASWTNWTEQLFVNPASASGGQDLLFANVVLFPLWTIIDGRRIGMRAFWLYFPMSIVTSYAFAVALYLALRERQVRWNALQGTATI